MSETPAKPLSEKPLGYALAAAGGLIGGPIGLVVSPLVLFGLGKLMKSNSEKKPNRFLAWAVLGVIGAPICLAPWLNSTMPSSTESSTSSPPAAQTSEASAPSVVPLGADQQVRDDRSLKVSGSETLDSISSGNQFVDPVSPKGGKLVAVYMTVRNTGKESGNMFWTNFMLEDSQGRKYDDIEDFEEIMTVNMWAKSQGLAETGDQLFPGATANTAAVFRVAPDAEGLRLLVNDSTYFAIQ